MPSPNNPNSSSQNQPAAEPTVVAEIPPLPADNIPPPPETNSTIPADAMSGEGAAPNFDFPPVVTPISPKKKFGGGKVIATILGLLILVGGLGAGVILIKQQQDIREKAAGPGQDCKVSGYSGTCSTLSACNQAGNIFMGTSTGGCVSPAGQNIGCCLPCYEGCLAKGNTPTECRAACPTTKTPTPVPTKEPSPAKGPTKEPSPTTTPTTTPQVQTCRPGWISGGINRDTAEEACIAHCGYRNVAAREGNCNWENRGSGTNPNWCFQCAGTTVTTTSSPAPTAPPPGASPTAQCLNVKAYDLSWNILSSSQLSSLKPGDTIRFAVAGTTTSGSFDRARFKINGVQRPEVTQKKPGSEEFYDEYTIPPGITTFTIGAQIHHTTLGWSE